jgi:hypothetical protein
MWPVTIASVWLLDDKGTIVATMCEAICSFALFLAYLTGRVERIVARPAEREQALVIAVDRLSDTATRPQPLLRVAP